MRIIWEESEWDEDVEAAYLNGIEGAVELDRHWSTGELTGNFVWWVKATAERCEWPELIDSGAASTRLDAKAAAQKAMRKADASYPYIQYG